MKKRNFALLSLFSQLHKNATNSGWKIDGNRKREKKKKKRAKKKEEMRRKNKYENERKWKGGKHEVLHIKTELRKK